MRYLLAALAYLAGALTAAALVLSMPAIGALAVAALTSSPGALQLGAVIVCALALRPAPIPKDGTVLDLDDDGLLFHLLLNVEVAS